DDSDLRVQVPLDSRDAVNWLRFQSNQQGGSWFGQPEKTPCTVTWTENETVQVQGSLDRVVRFDPRTRSLVAAIRMQQDSKATFPLVQGMFCRVDIAASSLEQVLALPKSAVTFEQSVYVVEENRLHTRKVDVARVQNGRALIRSGLEAGEVVIITRLENPPENSLVRVNESSAGGNE
ncbi:MAG: hypothetical protein D3925_20945, partial [Candidatus Electrothrix sp. AR5]|nr:hypothetical protein [Candidatus Electrothrix sp. AR5]